VADRGQGRLKVRVAARVATAGDAVVLPLAQADGSLPAAARDIDRALAGSVRAARGREFKGRFGETVTLFSMGRMPAARVVLLGLGKRELLDSTRVRNALQIGLRTVATQGSKRLVVAWTGEGDPDELAAAAVEAAVLTSFSEGTHKTSRNNRAAVTELALAGFPRLERAGLRAAQTMAEGMLLAKELVNLPPNELDPPEFSRRARALGRASGMECTVLGDLELRRRGYNAILSVSSGSRHPAQMIVLRYSPRAGRSRGARKRPLLALVGKGITFDTGGISIKPAAEMEWMKADMGGAAAVAGAMQAIAALRPDIDVAGILCCAENMPSGTAMRPADVIRSGSGKTIEVTNTDAEGRLVLADGIHHAVTLGATHILDIATLTGAQRIALGSVAGAVMGTDPAFTRLTLDSATAAGERAWEMPMFPEYESLLESSIADFGNSFGREGAVITPGMFLREFAAGLPFVHLDIAAPSWNHNARLSQVPRGPSGYGVRTLTRLAAALAQGGASKT
jgi:leucyl aminopeptidase